MMISWKYEWNVWSETLCRVSGLGWLGFMWRGKRVYWVKNTGDQRRELEWRYERKRIRSKMKRWLKERKDSQHGFGDHQLHMNTHHYWHDHHHYSHHDPHLQSSTFVRKGFKSRMTNSGVGRIRVTCGQSPPVHTWQTAIHFSWSLLLFYFLSSPFLSSLVAIWQYN